MLRSLPSHPADLPWPTSEWPPGAPAAGLGSLLDEAFDVQGPLHETLAVVVVQGGRLVAERYGGSLPHFDRPAEPVESGTALLSWSMAKSVLHALVGVLVGQGHLDLSRPPRGIPWNGPATTEGAGEGGAEDPRRSITLEQFLEMRDGLDFNEDYVDERESDTIAMLYGAGRSDVAAYAASRPLRHPPGQTFNYSSGTSNLISAAAHSVVGRGEALAEFLHDHLLGPMGVEMRLGYDEAGTWVASSYAYATARDWARFGYLYLRDGCWESGRLLPAGWVDHARMGRSVDPEDGTLHSAHWWVLDDGRGTFWANGYGGQSVTICPALDAVVVRLGQTPAEQYPALRAWRQRVLDALG